MDKKTERINSLNRKTQTQRANKGTEMLMGITTAIVAFYTIHTIGQAFQGDSWLNAIVSGLLAAVLYRGFLGIQTLDRYLEDDIEQTNKVFETPKK